MRKKERRKKNKDERKQERKPPHLEGVVLVRDEDRAVVERCGVRVGGWVRVGLSLE